MNILWCTYNKKFNLRQIFRSRKGCRMPDLKSSCRPCPFWRRLRSPENTNRLGYISTVVNVVALCKCVSGVARIDQVNSGYLLVLIESALEVHLLDILQEEVRLFRETSADMRLLLVNLAVAVFVVRVLGHDLLVQLGAQLVPHRPLDVGDEGELALVLSLPGLDVVEGDVDDGDHHVDQDHVDDDGESEEDPGGQYVGLLNVSKVELADAHGDGVLRRSDYVPGEGEHAHTMSTLGGGRGVLETKTEGTKSADL